MTHLIERFTEHLKKGKYNLATITAYRNAIFVFYNNYRDYPQSKFTDEFIGEYLVDLSTKQTRSEVLQAGKALKLFFRVIFQKELNLTALGNVKEEAHIDFLSKEEIKSLFAAVKNQKHRLLLQMVYANGLKINEIINLELSDVDFENSTIQLNSANQKKVRKLSLTRTLHPALKQYIDKYKPTNVLFTGSGGTKKYSARNIQLFFQKALLEANLNKNATLNSLRHSYAIHLLEKGLDLHILREIMGHSNLQTTSVYTQFVDVNLENIKSPIEDVLA